MLSAKRVVLVPNEGQKIQKGGAINDDFNFETNSQQNVGEIVSEIVPKKDRIKIKIYDKIHRFIKIIIKLARYSGYDEELRIRLKNGKYLDKSNIVDLLTHAMSAGKLLYGENEFIELLHNCGVDPELIINDNVKSKLLQFSRKSKPINEPMDINIINENLRKRKSDDHNDENQNKKRKRDDIEDSDGDKRETDETQEKITREETRDIEDDDIDNNDWDTRT
jgi:hypothetical protein